MKPLKQISICSSTHIHCVFHREFMGHMSISENTSRRENRRAKDTSNVKWRRFKTMTEKSAQSANISTKHLRPKIIGNRQISSFHFAHLDQFNDIDETAVLFVGFDCRWRWIIRLCWGGKLWRSWHRDTRQNKRKIQTRTRVARQTSYMTLRIIICLCNSEMERTNRCNASSKSDADNCIEWKMCASDEPQSESTYILICSKEQKKTAICSLNQN